VVTIVTTDSKTYNCVDNKGVRQAHKVATVQCEFLCEFYFSPEPVVFFCALFNVSVVREMLCDVRCTMVWN